MKERAREEKRQLQEEREDLIYNVQQLQQRRQALKRELEMRQSSTKKKKRTH